VSNQTSTIRPANITLNKQTNELVIAWRDGAECIYPLAQLREACPCVECRGGHQNMGAVGDPKNLLDLKPARSYKVESLELVGNYALQPFWDDGHHTGMYTWEYLRKLCPQPTSEQSSDQALNQTSE
jgi:DUF971 family protein